MWDVIKFQRMLTPLLIQGLFWIGIIACVAVSISDMVNHQGWIKGLQVLILGPLALRIIAEGLLLFFKIHENLMAIKKKQCSCCSDGEATKKEMA